MKSSTHPSVLELLLEALPGEGAEEIIIRKCRRIVAEARALGWKGNPHFDAEQLASLRGIKVVTKPAELNIGGEAALMPVRGRLEIWVKEGVTPERRRFSIFHEIAHTCFTKDYGRRHNHMSTTPLSEAERKFESLCDLGASELLFPIEEFRDQFFCQPFNGQAVLSLAKHFLGSEESLMHRIIEQRAWEGAALFLIINDAASSKCGLKVKYTIKHPNFGPAPWFNSPVPVKCVAYRCIESLQIEKQSTLFWHVGGKMRCYNVEAIPLPVIAVADAPRALVLLHPSKATKVL